jgi:uncharacterized RDD family membrane protein YckC
LGEQKKEETMATPGSAVPTPAPAAAKADLAKRFVALLIDAIPAILIGVIFGLIPFIGGPIAGIVVGGYWLVRDGLNLDFADKRSIGKKIMKLRPVRLDGQPMDINVSVKRNLPLAIYCVGYLLWIVPVLGHLVSIPIFLIGGLINLIEAILVVTDAEGRRWGDKMAGTKVIEVAQ